MPRRKNLDYENVVNLFDENGVMKQNEDFNEAYCNLFNKNTVVVPWTKAEILEQPQLKDFDNIQLTDFVYISDIYTKPLTLLKETENWSNSKIMLKPETDDLIELYTKKLGGVYIITAFIDNKEFVIKVGMSRVTLKGRISSYNCGAINNYVKGSVTNIRVLQSIIGSGVKYGIYFYHCGDPKTIIWQGIESVPLSSNKPIGVEDILVKKFKERFGKVPIGNVQANATVVKSKKKR